MINNKSIPCRRLGKRAHRLGATAVEFAVVAPLVFFFFFAAMEFCRVAMIRHTCDNAVYEAARRAIIPGGTATEASNQATAVLASLGVNSATVNITPAVLSSTTRDVTVRVTVPLDGNSYGPTKFFAGKTITRELTMRREGVR